MAAQSFGQLLKSFRLARGLTQEALATLGSTSPASISSYEEGRRVPDASVVDRLAAALQLGEEDHTLLRQTAGLRGLPGGFETALKRGRGPVDTVWDEVQTTPWVTLIVNERREIIAWNGLANQTSERDLGELSQFERGLLRMAATPYFERHLRNWDELIGRLISIFKAEGSDLSTGETNQWVTAILESITREDPGFLPRIFDLFVSTQAWREEDRNVHRVKWRLDDGTNLLFWGAFCDWNSYDGAWAFDWHAANSETAAWVQDAVQAGGHESARPELLSFGETIRQERATARMSMRQLAEETGLGVSTITAYESGRRNPSRVAVIALCRALNLDGYSTNRFLREFDHEEEPSDWARWIAGATPVGTYRNRNALHATSLQAFKAACDGLQWPSVLLDAGCHVVHANPLAQRLVPLRSFAPLNGRPGPHLLQLMVSRQFTEALGNWDEVAGVILPGRLEPLVLNAPRDASANNLMDVARELIRTERDGIDRVADVWRSSPGFTSLRRPGVPFHWTTPSGEQLAFNCVIAGLTPADPYKALDLFPADPATFRWLNRG